MEITKEVIKDNIVKVDIGLESENGAVSGAIELDIENQSHFVDMINSIFDEGNTQVIVDMKNVSYIDSSGLWALFEGHKKAAQKNGKMVLLNPNKDVKRVLDITKMSSKIQIFENQEDALKAL